MAHCNISAGGISVEIEDEDSDFKALARKARGLIHELIDKLEALGRGEADDEDDDG